MRQINPESLPRKIEDPPTVIIVHVNEYCVVLLFLFCNQTCKVVTNAEIWSNAEHGMDNRNVIVEYVEVIRQVVTYSYICYASLGEST